MKRITIEIDDKYATILSVTAIGVCGDVAYVTTKDVDTKKCNHMKLDKNGNWTIKMDGMLYDRSCETCMHDDCSEDDQPCCSCNFYSNWEESEVDEE